MNRASSAPVVRSRIGRGLAAALVALGAGLALNSLLGPLGFDVIDYQLSSSLQNQLIGLDAVSLVLVAPLCLAAGVLVGRGHPGGPVLALGPATYTAYMFVQYLVGPGYERYPTVLTFHLALFVLGGCVAVGAWTRVAADELPGMSERGRRAWSWVLIGLAAFVFSRYLPALAGSADGVALTEEFRAEPAFFWTIFVMDVGVVVPSAIAAALALRRAAPVGVKATYAIVGWFALVPPSVAAMAITMLVNDDPNGSSAAVVLFAAVAAVCTALAVWVYRPLFGAARPLGSPTAGSIRTLAITSPSSRAGEP